MTMQGLRPGFRIAVGIGLGLCLGLSAGASVAKARLYVSIARSDPFIDLLRDSVVNAATADGDVDLKLDLAEGNAERQLGQLKSALAQTYDAVIFMSVSDDAAVKAADMAAAAKTPLIYLNVMPPTDRFPGKVSIVASNDLVAGRLQMRLLAEKIKDNGSVVILRGAEGHPAAIGRTQGVKEILATKPGIKLVAEASANWGREDAEKQVTAWLQSGKKFDAVAANNDEMALGAIEALRKAGFAPGAIAVGGVDGTKDALAAMKSQELTVTLLQNAKAQGAQALLDAKKLAGKTYVQLYDWVPYELIIPSNATLYQAP